MLILTRSYRESIVFPDLGIKITIQEIRKGDIVRLGIEAPKEIVVHREEVWEAIQAKQKEGNR